MGLQILGTGSALPKKLLHNNELCDWMDTSDEWIYTRTGIHARHVITTETVTELAAAAGRRALEDAGVEAQELDLILAPTMVGDFITPSLACMVQRELGASCPAFDLNAACTGFLYALDLADAYLSAGKAKKILIVAAEGMSRLVNWQDRAVSVLFGDGAGAAVVGQGEDLLSIRLTAQGNYEPLYLPYTGGNLPLLQEEEALPLPYMKMQGQEVYKFAVAAVVRDLDWAMEAAGIGPEELGHVLLHQANQRIIEAAQKRSAIPADRFAVNIQEMGNVSAASIPILLDDLNRQGALQKGELMAMCGFGAGMTTGVCILRWSR